VSDLDPQISKLLQLKQYEQPKEGFSQFTEDFLKEFQESQREELLKKSSISLFGERFKQWWAESKAPVWAGATVAAVFVAVLGLAAISGSKNIAQDSLAQNEKVLLTSPEVANFPIDRIDTGAISGTQIASLQSLPVATVSSFEF